MKYIAFFVLVIILSGISWWLLIQKPVPTDTDIKSSWHINPSPSPSLIAVLPLTSDRVLDSKTDPNISDPQVVSILVTGDVLTARTVNRLTIESGDFRWPWLFSAAELQAADITYINLETPLVTDCPIKDGGFIFCGDVRHTQGLLFAGVDVANLANNHMANYGAAGIADTISTLNNAGIAMSGLDVPAIIEKNGIRFAFVGFNEVGVQPGVNTADPDFVASHIKQAKTMADVVIAQFHWGAEYQRQPTSNQVRLAHLAVESGADLVVGNHPHWWQPAEIYQDTLIMYSHGNFIFDQMWSTETRQGMVGKYYFYQGKLLDVEFLPMQIEEYGQAHWLEGDAKQALLDAFHDQTIVRKKNAE